MLTISIPRLLALGLGLCLAAAAGAQPGGANNQGNQSSGGKAPSLTTNSGATTHPSPGGGPAFGQHVSGMAPTHPIMHGRHFGECVSAMAQGLECNHDHHDEEQE